MVVIYVIYDGCSCPGSAFTGRDLNGLYDDGQGLSRYSYDSCKNFVYNVDGDFGNGRDPAGATACCNFCCGSKDSSNVSIERVNC